MSKRTPNSLHVFIGCPGDMAPERDAIRFAREHIESVVCPVKFTTWKTSASGVGEPQRVIFENDPVESFDVVIILLWHRLGVPSGYHDPLTKLEMTGTEAEFVAAYDLHQSSGGRRPQVLLYRCQRDLPPDVDVEQLGSVRKFFKQTEKGGPRPMLSVGFKTAEDLKDIVTRNLQTAAKRLRAAEKKPATSTSSKKKTPKASGSMPDSGMMLHRYFTNLRDQFATYENVGLPVPERDGKEGEQDVPIPIRKLFVAPACTEAHFRPEAFDSALCDGKNPATPLLPRLSPAKSRTVLLADPGMGKSTLIQWLISTLADEAVPPGAEALRGAIPLPFILRDLVGHLPKDLKNWNWNALVDAFRQWRHRGRGAALAAPLTADEASFRSLLASDGAFFLIDGLDEIGDPQRRIAIRNAIWEGFEKYPLARWLITSRIVGYEQAVVERKCIIEWDPTQKLTPELAKRMRQKLIAAGIPESERMPFGGGNVEPTSVHLQIATLLHLAPFDNEQQLSFARNWFVPRLGDAAGTQRAEDFIAAVHRNDHTRTISRVPNLLYLLALLFRHRARLPDGRALVYSAISSAYLADIDFHRRLPDSLLVPWKFDEKEELLALVAMRMQEIRAAKGQDENGDVLVNRQQLEEWLAPRFRGSGDAETCAELHRFLDHIANRSGLLLPRGEGVFGFAHLSFQEYYAACFLEKEFQRILTEKSQDAANDIFGPPSAAAKKDEEKMFAEMAILPAWHEPILFLVEKLRQSAPYTRRILSWTFPQLAEPLQGPEGSSLAGVKDWMPFTTARLLASISLDQEVNLDDAQRSTIWRSLWQAHIAASDGEWDIASSLIVSGSLYQTAVLDAAVALKPAKLRLGGCAALTDLKLLAGLSSLTYLSLDGCTGLSDLKPLAGLASLTELSLSGCTGVSDLKPLEGLASLTFLNLDGSTGVGDLKSVASLGSLTTLSLERCTGVSDLKPLASLGALTYLYLNGCTGVSDLKPLAGLASLNYLNLNGCIGVSDEVVASLEASLPKLTIRR